MKKFLKNELEGLMQDVESTLSNTSEDETQNLNEESKIIRDEMTRVEEDTENPSELPSEQNTSLSNFSGSSFSTVVTHLPPERNKKKEASDEQPRNNSLLSIVPETTATEFVQSHSSTSVSPTEFIDDTSASPSAKATLLENVLKQVETWLFEEQGFPSFHEDVKEEKGEDVTQVVYRLTQELSNYPTREMCDGLRRTQVQNSRFTCDCGCHSRLPALFPSGGPSQITRQPRVRSSKEPQTKKVNETHKRRRTGLSDGNRTVKKRKRPKTSRKTQISRKKKQKEKKKGRLVFSRVPATRPSRADAQTASSARDSPLSAAAPTTADCATCCTSITINVDPNPRTSTPSERTLSPRDPCHCPNRKTDDTRVDSGVQTQSCGPRFQISIRLNRSCPKSTDRTVPPGDCAVNGTAKGERAHATLSENSGKEYVESASVPASTSGRGTGSESDDVASQTGKSGETDAENKSPLQFSESDGIGEGIEVQGRSAPEPTSEPTTGEQHEITEREPADHDALSRSVGQVGLEHEGDDQTVTHRPFGPEAKKQEVQKYVRCSATQTCREIACFRKGLVLSPPEFPPGDRRFFVVPFEMTRAGRAEAMGGACPRTLPSRCCVAPSVCAAQRENAAANGTSLTCCARRYRSQAGRKCRSRT